MEIKDLLPIGSVVLLEDGEKRLMISGILQTDGGEGKQYDYMGVLYPEGHLGGKFQYLFDHKDIVKIVFRGYEDEERTSFIKQLTNYYREN